jgi:hypothetical protein
VQKTVVPKSVAIGLGVMVLIIFTATAGALAFNGEGNEGQGTGDNASRVVDRLADAGITTDTAALDALADTYGLGGAVRILAFADAAGIDPADVAAMRDDGMGWGAIARALADAHDGFDLTPGIGWIMGGNGHGNSHGHGQGQGQAKPHDEEPSETDGD